LRDLTEAEERQFLAAHPALEAEVSHRARQGNRAGRRGSAAAVTMESHRPYAEPEYWAAFIIAGL
jgi:CHAT domain-containing protein